MTPRPPYLASHITLIPLSKNNSSTLHGDMPASWNRRTQTPVDRCSTGCWRSAPKGIKDAFPSAAYVMEHSPEQTVQLHISDTSTWTTVPTGAKVLVGQRDGASLSHVYFMDISDISCMQPATFLLARELDATCQTQDGVVPSLVSTLCPGCWNSF